MPSMALSAVLVRRWYVALLGFVVTLFLCAFAAHVSPVKYKAQAVVLLVPAAASVDSNNSVGANPFFGIAELKGLGDVLAQAMSSDTTAVAVASKGLRGTYKITSDPASSGPLMLIVGESTDPATAISTVREVVALVPQTLDRLQLAAGVTNHKYYVTSTTLNPPTSASKVRKSQIRAVIAAGAVGLLLTFFALAGTEKFLARRKRRESDAPAVTELESDTEGPGQSVLNGTRGAPVVSSPRRVRLRAVKR